MPRRNVTTHEQGCAVVAEGLRALLLLHSAEALCEKLLFLRLGHQMLVRSISGVQFRRRCQVVFAKIRPDKLQIKLIWRIKQRV